MYNGQRIAFIYEFVVKNIFVKGDRKIVVSIYVDIDLQHIWPSWYYRIPYKQVSRTTKCHLRFQSKRLEGCGSSFSDCLCVSRSRIVRREIKYTITGHGGHRITSYTADTVDTFFSAIYFILFFVVEERMIPQLKNVPTIRIWNFIVLINSKFPGKKQDTKQSRQTLILDDRCDVWVIFQSSLL